MKRVISFSTGIASAITTVRVLEKYQDAEVVFLDTHWEDEDNYRFLKDFQNFIKKPITILSDGRTPLEVGEDNKVIPNPRMGVCTLELKQKVFKRYLETLQKPITIYIGFDITELHRIKKSQKIYEEAGYQVDFPLTWEPYPEPPYEYIIREWGLEPPRMYELGYTHANCFSGDTRFITRAGVKTFQETVGQPVEVLSGNGSWTKTQVQCFGEQQLYEITLSYLSQTKKIHTTKDHQWYIYPSNRGSHRIIKETSELKYDDRFIPTESDRPGFWKVVSVKSIDRIEPVYCVYTPPHHNFVLDDNILTHNCSGTCLKQGQGDWLRTLHYFPERYLSVEEWEEYMQKEVLKKDYTILTEKDKRGRKKPISLKELRQKWQNDKESLSPTVLRKLDHLTGSCIQCDIGDFISQGETPPDS